MMETKAPAGLKLVRPEAKSADAPLPSQDQKEVIGLPAGCGPVLVLGGPGTGKTTALVEHAVRRVEETGLDPAGLLFMAPNRLAASRLRDALTARLDQQPGHVPGQDLVCLCLRPDSPGPRGRSAAAGGTGAPTAVRARTGPDHRRIAGRPSCGLWPGCRLAGRTCSRRWRPVASGRRSASFSTG